MSMFLSSLITLALVASTVSAQDIVYDSAHNVTAITGTWASGSQHVVPGAVRCLPLVLKSVLKLKLIF